MTLAARDLAIGYGRHVVGEGIDFSLGGGDIVCLLGPNGCGKTTLFKTLLGLIPALSGEVVLDGAPITRLGRAAIARRIAYVPQSHVPPFPYPVLEVVLMGCAPRLGLLGQPGQKERDEAVAALERLGLGHLAEQDYSRLSGGQRQMVLIARALAQQADLMVMDEPGASLDFGNQARLLQEVAHLARDAARRGIGVVMSTHNPDHAWSLDAKVVLMHDGGVIAAGAPTEVLTAERLTRIYGVPVAVETTGSGRRVCITSAAFG